MSQLVHNRSPYQNKASFAANTLFTRDTSTDVNDGREQLVRNRLRWLEGNWDGKEGGPQALYDRRRATRERRERAPRWDGQLAPQNVKISASPQRWPEQQQKHYNKDSASGENSALDAIAKVAQVSTSVSSAESATDGAGNESEEACKNRQTRFSNSNGGAIQLSGTNDYAVVQSQSVSSQIGLSNSDCDMVPNRCSQSSPSASPVHSCTSSSMQSEESSPRSEVQPEGSCVLLRDDVSQPLLSGHFKIEEEASSPRVLGANTHLPVRETISRSASSVGDSEDEATSSTQSPTQARQLAIQPVAGGAVRRKPQRDEERSDETAALVCAKNRWKLRAIRAANERMSPRNDMEGNNNLFGITSPTRPAKSTAVGEVYNYREDGANSIALEFDETRSDSSRASSFFRYDGGHANSNADSKWSSPSLLGKGSNCGKATPSPLDTKTRTAGNHNVRNESCGVSDGCKSSGRITHSCYFGDDKPFSQARRPQEVDYLKEELRKAEIRQAVAEATATSMLQRARAAELSRDVKELQIRNLEVRLAIFTCSKSHHGERNAQRQGRQPDEHGDCGMPKQYFHRREPLPGVEQEMILCQENSDRLPHSTAGGTAGQHSSSQAHRLSTPSASLESKSRPSSATCAADVAASQVATAAGWETRLRKFEGQLRQRCVVIGATVAKASGVAVETANDAAQSTAAGRAGGGSLWRGRGAVRRREEAKGGSIASSKVSDCNNQMRNSETIDEYWGSDHCTSA